MIGYKSILVNGVRWRENQGGMFPLFPPHTFSNFTNNSAFEVLNKEDALFIRWESEFDQSIETPWWHVINSSGCKIEDLSSKTRAKVRKGGRCFHAEIVEPEEVCRSCYPVYVSAFSRYDTHERKMTESEFVSAIKSLPQETEFWVVYDNDTNEPVAFSENLVSNRVCSYITTWYNPDSLKRYSSYFLIQLMTEYYLAKIDIDYVSNGARNISHDTNAHELLENRFNFRKAYARLHVVYSPLLDFAVKCAYPFRHLIKRIPFDLFKKASILLKQEEIRRRCLPGC